MVGDNAQPTDGWTLPPRCCGTWGSGLTCGICGNWLHELPEPHLVRGEN